MCKNGMRRCRAVDGSLDGLRASDARRLPGARDARLDSFDG